MVVREVCFCDGVVGAVREPPLRVWWDTRFYDKI